MYIVTEKAYQITSDNEISWNHQFQKKNRMSAGINAKYRSGMIYTHNLRDITFSAFKLIDFEQEKLQV